MKKQVKKGIVLAAMVFMLCGMSLAVYAKTYNENVTINNHTGSTLQEGDILQSGTTLTVEPSPYYDVTCLLYVDSALWKQIGTGNGNSGLLPTVVCDKAYKIVSIDAKAYSSGQGSLYIYLEEYTDPTPTPAPTPAWRPTTPEDIERYSFFAPTMPTVISEDGAGAKVSITNAVQGPACIECFKLFMPKDYEIGYTYNIYPAGFENSKIYQTEEEITFTMEIPKSLQAEGRTFKLLCISDKGMPYLYENEAKEADRITITTDRFYAYALLYTDKAE